MIAGIGLGMMLTSLCLLPFRYGEMNAYEVEVEAKKMGMIYPGSNRVLTDDQKTSEPAINGSQDAENEQEEL